MSWMRYLLEANLYLSVFYIFYLLLLSRETHYALNRAYLLFGCLVSFVLPVLQLGFLKSVEPAGTVPVVSLPVNITDTAIARTNPVPPAHLTVQDGLFYVYVAGVLILALLLAIKLIRLFALTHKRSVSNQNGYKLVELNGSATAFSFFSLLFIGTETNNRETIIRHEMVHARQKHSFDIILLELIKIVNWFNPLVYMVQTSLKAVHEYIADEKTAAVETDTVTYSTFLVNNAYGVGGPSVTHSFFNKNLLKQRIIMLHQKRSGNLARLKYLLAVPVCAALLCISTLAFSKTYGWVDLLPRHKSAAAFSPPIQQHSADTNKATHKKNTYTYKNSTYTYNNSNVTGKGYNYKETGYLVNGKTDFRVVITEKNGEQKSFFRDSATPAQIKMLQEQYGYTFPSMDIFAKLPPAPPAPAPPAKLADPKAPRLAPPVVIPVDTLAPVQPAVPSDAQTPPPPMAPYMPLSDPFEGLKKYLSRHVLYPTVEFKNRTMGSAIIKFDVNTDHKIANASLVKGFASACDDEALSVVKSFNETIDKAPGTYQLAITFYLDGLKAPQPASATLSADQSFIGEVVIEMYPN